MCYGEGSLANVADEMAAISAVLIRQAKARGLTVGAFLHSDEAKAFSLVLADGNARYSALSRATEEAIAKDAGMTVAINAARHALAGKSDYSAGAYFWDGADLKSNLTNHPKVLLGIRFSFKEHDIYAVGDHKIKEKTEYWMVKDKTGKTVRGAERGRYDCTYESTAAFGGTVFWRFTPEFLKATGNKEFK